MHPLSIPVFSLIGGLTLFGLMVVSAIGAVRRPDPAKLRAIWLKYGVHIGMMALVLVAGALGKFALLPVTLFLAYRGWVELLRAIASRHGAIAHPALVTLLGALGTLGGLFGGPVPLMAGVAIATWAALALPMLLERRPPALHGLLATALGMVLITMPVGTFLLLGAESYGAFAFLYLLLMANDGLSEGLGRLFGKTPIWPDISPNKTWGGTIGGILSSLVLGYLMRFLVPEWSAGAAMAVAAGVSLFAGIGDLLASSIKREVGVKDFGQVLPGHGGVLDRFDSLLFATPVFYGVARLLGVS